MPNLENVKKIYFVGIGGIGMSAAANLAREAGFEVSGSDSKEIYPPAKNVLDQHKISYFTGYDGNHIEESGADMFVLSAGEGPENPEVKRIIEKKLPYCGFAELLYELSKDNLRVVVTGTHGKTTTAGALGHLFKNLDGSGFLTGGVLQNYQNNFYNGDGHYFIFEGDEYKNLFDDPTPKFHYYKPDILVLTNLEYDHPDMFPSFEDLEREFAQLIDEMPEDGLIIYNADNINLAKLVHQSNVASIGFGIENETDFFAEKIDYGPEFTTMEVINKNTSEPTARLLRLSEEYKIQLPGKLNVYNILAAAAAARALGFSADSVAMELAAYKGIKRRFELVARKNGVTVIDDYAHHPTAVKETLKAAKLRYPESKIWAVFEPHTFSRTKATLSDLSKAFEAADEVLISEIYPAREKISEATIKSAEVVQAIGAHKNNTRLVHDKQEALDILKSEAKSGDVIVVMAVGSFNRLAYELKDIL